MHVQTTAAPAYAPPAPPVTGPTPTFDVTPLDYARHLAKTPMGIVPDGAIPRIDVRHTHTIVQPAARLDLRR